MFYNLADVLTKALGSKSFVLLTWFWLFGKGPRFTMGSNKNESKSVGNNDTVSKSGNCDED